MTTSQAGCLGRGKQGVGGQSWERSVCWQMAAAPWHVGAVDPGLLLVVPGGQVALREPAAGSANTGEA